MGFRWWTRCRARELGLSGWAENLADGRVRVVAEGVAASCAALLEALRGPAAPGEVSDVTVDWGGPSGHLGRFVER